ncbi:MAG: inositol monophosphatase family protein [Solirubrobacterales bacterium]
MAGESGDHGPWLEACRRMVAGQRAIFEEVRGIAARTEYEGVGEGGDNTLVIDRRCEDVAFAELERLHAEGKDFVVVSEERGEVVFGDSPAPQVIVDPIDGSLNVRRTIPAHRLSVAVASGPTMADVEFGFVHDFGAGEEFSASRGKGASLDSQRIVPERPYDGLEVVGIESASPEHVAPLAAALQGKAIRLRSPGSIAITLSYVAAARFDGMLSGRTCRSVDAAAGQLIVREAGAAVGFAGLELTEATLDLSARYGVAAAFDAANLETILEVQRETL